MFDYSKLRGKIKEVFCKQSAFAKALNISEPTLSKKLNNETEFSQFEIYRSCELLGLEFVDIPVYFFNQKVS